VMVASVPSWPPPRIVGHANVVRYVGKMVCVVPQVKRARNPLLPEIGHTLGFPGSFPGLSQNRQEYASQNRNDGNRHQQLNQAEPICRFEIIFHAYSDNAKAGASRLPGHVLALFLVGTARCAVRAAFSGETSLVGCPIANVPRALRAVTAQRAVPTTIKIKNSVRMRPGCVATLKLSFQILVILA
jgi:hypothetical protein